MRSSIFRFLWLAALALTACGVKGPPVAPIREYAIEQNLDCSPYDPKCDRIDDDYVPGLDPSKPADAKRIKALEEAAKKQKAAKAQ